ncbi:MAG: exo-alpha-sialidase [bacterium]|nr:exo-alpha-sialidase [bacterium]
MHRMGLRFALALCSVACAVLALGVAQEPEPPRGYSIPTIDLANETGRRVVVDREPGQYLGHPTTVLLEDGKTMITVYPKGHGKGAIVMKRSEDGGRTWGEPVVIARHRTAHLCEPGLIRSPDGARIAVLLRENSRKLNSFVIFSDDEGATWSEPRQVPGALTGDRHTGVYAPDGRLLVSFRDRTLESPTAGDWVAWVGTFDDIAQGTAWWRATVRSATPSSPASCTPPRSRTWSGCRSAA